MSLENLLDRLKSELGESAVILAEEIGEKYLSDWSGESAKATPKALIRPANTNEVSQLMKLCHDAGQAVAVQGGMSGLSAGAVPENNELAVSLERMSGIEEIDSDSMTMTVLSGTPLQTIQEAAAAAGLNFPLDLGARGSCTIGGNVSTNAGGNQVIRFGMTRALILGLEAVLADGTVVSSLNKMLKNNAGYDLKHLFIGTEGTLGIVTRVVLRLYPKLSSRCTALCALASLPDVITLLKLTGSKMGGLLSSYEVMWANYYDLVIDQVSNLQSPFDEKHAFYVLMEIEGSDQDQDSERFQSMLASALESNLIQDAAIAQSEKESAAFWQIRDGVGEILPNFAPCANFDISVPISEMQTFVDNADKRLEDAFPSVQILVFGHLGDSNLHYIARTGRKEDKEKIYNIIYELTGEHNGSISAEHGIGKIKRSYLKYSRNEVEIKLMRQLKNTFDPKGILNPNRVI
ncbi:MAG: FAD/FMN-containing dehydrogenase [Planctomycetota bacterium]|jgi:FAD/FMN-containing dehydrogenase